MDKVKSNKQSEKLVNAICKDKNIKAKKYLENIIKDKCVKRIKSVLAN